MRNGYKLLEAADGHAALDVWKQHHAGIDLLYTDMVMPGEWTGLQLAERFIAEKPSLKVIITSGYHTDVPETAGARIVHVPKPCAPAALTLLIQQCLRST